MVTAAAACVCVFDFPQAPDESDDDDIVVPNDNKVSLKCPINLTTMVDPMKSKVSVTRVRRDRTRNSAGIIDTCLRGERERER